MTSPLKEKEASDLVIKKYRQERFMPLEEAKIFLQKEAVAHVASTDKNGWPYVIPLVYIYEGKDLLYIHTGSHQGHFYKNISQNEKICLEVSEMGRFAAGNFACNSSLTFTSVVLFGKLKVIDDIKKKQWFMDKLIEKYSNPGWEFKPGYPFLEKVTLYVVEIELLTGKNNKGLYH